jgi:tryptophan-rich sensory protein
MLILTHNTVTIKRFNKKLILFIFVAMEVLKDLWGFLKERKKFWLAPIIIVLLLLGLLIVFAGGSAVSPFVYTIF